jgi:hypothetical protein
MQSFIQLIKACLSVWEKRPQREAEHSPASNVEVKKKQNKQIPLPLFRERNMPTERQPIFDEI